MSHQIGTGSTAVTKTEEYLRIPSVVGHEAPLLNHLHEEYLKLGFRSVRGDNIVAVSGDEPTSGYLCAHVDRHGILSIGGGDYRYAAHAVKNYKYSDDESSNSLSFLNKICSRFENQDVFAFGRWSGNTIASGTIQQCFYCTERANLIFKIDDMNEMPEGIPVAYTAGPLEKDGYISGQLDNALSLGIIFELFEAGFRGTAFFTAEEEIGKSWQHLTAFLALEKIETDQLIILDTSPYDDAVFANAGTVVLRNRDSSGIFNAELVDKLRSTCGALLVPYDFKDETLLLQGKTQRQLGSTELGRIIEKSASRWTGATLQVPSFNYHTNDESTTKLAIANAIAVLIKNFEIGK